MHIFESFDPGCEIPITKVLTFEGEARSGKGTSVRAFNEALGEVGRSVLTIDQGLKFRTLACLALGRNDPELLLEDQDYLSEFLIADTTRDDMLSLLGDVAVMPRDKMDALLYTSDISKASGMVGKNPLSHDIAISLLFDQVKVAANNKVDTVLIDGRCMEKYGRRIADEQIAQYVMGFYFRCDAAVAARRTTGIFVDHHKMSVPDRLCLLEEITKISDRNRSDTLRSVDPMREPANSYRLDLSSFDDNPEFVDQYTVEALQSGMIALTTTYTKSVEEMTVPVVAIARRAVEIHDEERQAFMADPALWNKYSVFSVTR